ncbi:hypothetical protein MIND_00404900 [Mycena indigotica]|uniref:Uncharacterized protein n=1 Tax=Mycena indigotica TaxID=2126181 RepID=A0A8H6WD08_9AGAR|nr:uncharacterized protein MIND_00404900 [Mycena indigotica]KAF7310308.1 hypothetical protein MIND_00404900 [Mycena indigotica]
MAGCDPPFSLSVFQPIQWKTERKHIYNATLGLRASDYRPGCPLTRHVPVGTLGYRLPKDQVLLVVAKVLWSLSPSLLWSPLSHPMGRRVCARLLLSSRSAIILVVTYELSHSAIKASTEVFFAARSLGSQTQKFLLLIPSPPTQRTPQPLSLPWQKIQGEIIEDAAAVAFTHMGLGGVFGTATRSQPHTLHFPCS